MVSDTRKLRSLDLFSGIGGISLALQLWCETVCYCEIDPYAAGVLVKNMAEGNIDVAPIWSDVTTFGRTEIDQVGPVDIICGGFPCQDLSVAGKRAGLKGERSGLFFEIVRLIRLARPRYVFLENVPGLLTGGMDTVLKELSESGYDAEWHVLGADDVGANHHRKRVWILARAESRGPGGLRNASSDLFRECGGVRPDVADADMWRRGEMPQREFISGREAGPAFQLLADAGRELLGGGQPTSPDNRSQEGSYPEWWAVEPDVGRLANGLPYRVDRLRCLGNSVVPLCARTAFEMLINRKEFL